MATLPQIPQSGITITLPDAKRRAYRARLKDTGWGRAAAHFIPWYWLYYAISRRTITPLLYGDGCLLLASFLAFSLYYEQELVGGIVALLSLPAKLFGCKFGIHQAREHARMLLKTED